ncbi:uncharacterized protein LOC127254176 [Andrographis paniculata]|uniref:uncharacterized protein LOC127254176 n=1 Tax=Andrographis paniculata TaxID=175694 RepID=UPI0021E8BDBD|nr:uncharacterized protein LOC127254176 [Andrographis paniculata]
MSGNERQSVSVRDLVEEAKKRVVFLVVSVVGLSYLMSLTSPSVLVNLPCALILIVIARYLSLDFDMRRKAMTYKGKQPPETSSSRKPLKIPTIPPERSDWKLKVNSPVVEDAIDQFTRHIVSEWVTDLWYSRITPDRQVPEELVLIINGVLGEISSRMRNINLIDLLTRDIIDILCNRLELFRESKAKIEKHHSRSLTIEEHDERLKAVLATEYKLHPITFSAESEHKVLQHVMDGLILLTFKHEDMQCSLFRYVVRELLACVVIRPVLNLANPRFINERIESLVVSARRNSKGNTATSKESQPKISTSPKTSSDLSLQFPDPSIKGVELVQLKKDQSNKSDNTNGDLLSKDPLLSMDTRSTRSWSALPDTHGSEVKGIQRHRSGGEWGDKLDDFSRRKTEALAPEHFDNMWTKGRHYKKNEDANQVTDPTHGNSLVGASNPVESSKVPSEVKQKQLGTVTGGLKKDISSSGYNKDTTSNDNTSMHNNASNESGMLPLCEEEDLQSSSNEDESWSSDYTEEDDSSSAMGLDSPGVKVWDGKNKRNYSHIHHPLETFDKHKNKTRRKNHLPTNRLHRTKSAKKRSKPSSSHNGDVWQEVERSSFLLGDGQDVLNSPRVIDRSGDSSEDSESELLGRIASGAATSSSISLSSLPENQILAASSAKTSLIADSYFQLRCEVLGANIVKGGSKTFAVYCIAVTDLNNHSWSIKRRFQHFVELHRRLKAFRDYDLHLPPKHFLSTGLDLLVIQERCNLLDQYLKKLLQLPTVSCSIEVWDFLSVDSQMYVFSDSLSIIDTISVDRDESLGDKSKDYRGNVGSASDPLSSKRDHFSNTNQNSSSQIKGSQVLGESALITKGQGLPSTRKAEKEFKSNGGSENTDKKNVQTPRNLETANSDQQESPVAINNSPDPTIPSEWVPPSLSVPILNLVDVILQLKDGGWIRRKAFWVAKQVLQLGMGDAFDDWLIEKIQHLRRGPVVASGINRLEQILWPDGIFITKHPRRQQPLPPPDSPSKGSPGGKPPTPHSSPKVTDALKLEEMQRREAERRAKFVYELMIDKAPAAIVGLVGHKEYEQCAKDLYYFIQSPVFMKQVGFDLLEVLLVSSFPELDSTFKELVREKDKFGVPKPN